MPKRTKKSSVEESPTRNVSELRKAADRKKVEKMDLQPKVTEPKKAILERKVAETGRKAGNKVERKTEARTSDGPRTRMSRHQRK